MGRETLDVGVRKASRRRGLSGALKPAKEKARQIKRTGW